MGINGMSLQIFQHSALTVAKSCYTVYTRALADSMMTNHSDPTLCQHQFAQNGLNDEGALKNSREAEDGLPSELTSVHLRSRENIWKETGRTNPYQPGRKTCQHTGTWATKITSKLRNGQAIIQVSAHQNTVQIQKNKNNFTMSGS